jgi:predicted Zn-dependent peptidase
MIEEEIARLELEDCRQAVMTQFYPANMEICVVGDFEPNALEPLLLRYMGTLTNSKNSSSSIAATASAAAAKEISTEMKTAFELNPALFHMSFSRRAQRSLLTIADDVDRTAVVLAFPRANRFGASYFPDFVNGGAASASASPPPPGWTDTHLQTHVAMILLVDICNHRLFHEIREQRGLVYSITLGTTSLMLFDGSYQEISFMAAYESVDATVQAIVEVLRSVVSDGVSEAEFAKCHEPLVARVSDSLQDNQFLLSMLTATQWPFFHRNVADVSALLPTYRSMTKDIVSFAARRFWAHFERYLVQVIATSSSNAADGAEQAPA